MNPTRVLVDSGGIYAFLDRKDEHHREAVAFVKRGLKRGNAFVLADIVFSELMTLAKARLGPPVAVRVGRALRESPSYVWAPLGVEGERDTWAIFEKYDDKEWSYTDCAILALSRRLGVKTVFGFDDHFDQMPDLERVP
jgi:predicted nucleic acid-binding protein